MKITVNGTGEELAEEMSILNFLGLKGLNPDNVVVEHNYQIVKKNKWAETTLKENDNLEILAFVGGG